MLEASAQSSTQSHAACSGCSLCLLVCPVWRSTRDLRLTPHGRAKALQHGVSAAEIAPSIESCTLCGACEPVCPENIDLVGMLLELRRALPPTTIGQNLQTRMHAETTRLLAAPRASAVKLLADVALSMHPVLLARIRTLLGNACAIAVGNDSGTDLTQALEMGVALPAQRVERLLASLRPCKTIVVADGLLLRHLRDWLPHARIVSVGVALNELPAVRQGLRTDDLYVIEPRAYHGDYARLVKYYDRLRADTGCALNLDLQRIAIPATLRNMAQRVGGEAPADGERVRWLLHGRRVSRIVVESEDDRATFERYCDVPVVHLAEVAGAAIAQRSVA